MDCVDGDTLPGWQNKTKKAQHPDDFAEPSHHTCSQKRRMYFHIAQAAVRLVKSCQNLFLD